MEKITVPILLSKYQKRVKKGEIQFLKKESDEQKDVLKLAEDLTADIMGASKKGDLSEYLNWYETHQKGKKLWHALCRYALYNIDPSSKGSSELFKFLDAATEFEDLLYGLELYYRDHTLHSLWVYLIGDYLMTEHLPDIYQNLNWYLYNDIVDKESDYRPGLIKDAKEKEKEFYKKVNEKKDAIWCVMALCHDLGYSVEKLNMLNQKIENVLNYFDLRDLNCVGYSLNLEHQYLANQFLNLMAVDVRIVPSSDMREVLVKLYRDDGTYWRLCKSLEKRQHGILSAYLIYKILGIFAEASLRGPGEEWGLEDEEVIENLIRGDILFAIAQHQFDYTYLDELSSLADILILSDEIEEFSRFGRQLQSREYYDTHAECSIGFKRSKKDIDIEILYDVKEKHPMQVFFPWKAKRISELYSLRSQTDNNKYNKIRSIRMRAEKNTTKLYFYLGRDAEYKAYLPAIKYEDMKFAEGEYKVRIQDDNLFVLTEKRQIPMIEWFNYVIN